MLTFSLLMPLVATLFAQQGPGQNKPVANAPAAAPATQTPAAPAPAPAGIAWSATRRLTAADFQGRPTLRETQAAYTVADIKAGTGCKDYVFYSTVEAKFDPAGSWIRDPKTLTDALLRHEQLHFDMAELYARKLRQKLVVFKQKADCHKLQPAFDNLTKAVYAEWQRDMSRYDQETNHGRNAAKQGYWERQIQIKLDQLKAYSLPG